MFSLKDIQISASVAYKELQQAQRDGAPTPLTEELIAEHTEMILNATKIVEDKLKANKPTPSNPQGNKPF